MKKMKLAFAAVAFAISGFANATVITVSTSGMLDSGQDTLGLFGAPGRNLANLPYALTVTFGFDSPERNFSGPNGSAGSTREPFVAVLIIDGVRYADFIDQISTSQISMLLPKSGASGINFDSRGSDAAGTFFNAHAVISQNIYTDTLTDYLNVPLQGTAAITLQLTAHKASDILKDSNPSTFVLNGDPATLTPPVPPAPPVPDPAPLSGPTPVPEPTSAMLFGAGLLGFAALRRRQSRH
jgi:hypothetical protein